MNPPRFTAALSYPGERRDFVAKVAERLAAAYDQERVLYDEFHDAEFARVDLNIYLPSLYRKDSELIVIFLCLEYAAKLWCKLEWRHIRQLIATEDAKRIMLLSFGDPGDLSDLGILSGDGYIDIAELTPEVVARKIQKRLNLNRGVTVEPITDSVAAVPVDISRTDKYAPAELIGREDELKLLNDAWAKVQNQESGRPHILTFVALGGEGKTSLVAKWIAALAAEDWPSCAAIFAWSFYSQGTRDQVAASSDLFLKEALNFFGDDSDKEFAASNAGAFEKGQRLARIVGERRYLLILDGLEPLQYAPTSPTPGELKDAGLAVLLKGLAVTNRGLCIVTTRYSIPDLRAYWQTTAPEVKLTRLSRDAGVHLLKTLGVRGTAREFAMLVEDVKGHALTLTLLGSYLGEAHGGDIRKRDLVKLEEADTEIVVMTDHPNHAFHVMDAYGKWLETGGKNEEENKKGLRALALLRLLGLFDRPASADCLQALWTGESISNLTEPLVRLNDAQRNIALTRLEAAKLLTVNRDASGALVSLDAHPHLREYFARQLRTQQPDAWRAAHRRLYEHLCATTKEGDQPTLEDLQPLYQAVAHGCQAGLQQRACDEVYFARLARQTEHYSARKLGALGSDLGAAACFFEQPWSRVSPALTEGDQAWMLNEAAYRLRALGRLAESLEPMRAGVENYAKQSDWKNAARAANNLSELELTLGTVARAVVDAQQSMSYADRSGDVFLRMARRTTYADALHQAGRRDVAETRFREAEKMWIETFPHSPLMSSTPGFRYCELLLEATERTAWQRTIITTPQLPPEADVHKATLLAVSGRATKAILVEDGRLLDIALDHLTLGRAAFYAAILEGSEGAPRRPLAVQPSNTVARISPDELETARREVTSAVGGLRRAGQMDELPRGLLTQAWLHFVEDECEAARHDLDEAWEIAERGPMRLFMADIHLYRARLFRGMKDEGGEMRYPWDKNVDGSRRGPKDDLAAAEKLINECGYHRRDEELADAKEAAKNWQ